MPIKVEQEPKDFPWKRFGLENCCFCDTPTDTWYTPKDVACCKSCAKTKKPADVPTKEQWCANQAKLHKHF